MEMLGHRTKKSNRKSFAMSSAAAVELTGTIQTSDITHHRAAAAWCARIRGAPALASQPVSRGEAEALFAINEAAAERSDAGRFDDLFAKAVVHHAASASGLPVPPRAVALSPDIAIETWAPTRAVGFNVEVLEWIGKQM